MTVNAGPGSFAGGHLLWTPVVGLLPLDGRSVSTPVLESDLLEFVLSRPGNCWTFLANTGVIGERETDIGFAS